MLISMLPFAAQRPPRHHFQDQVLDLVDKELQAKLAAIKSGISRSQATVSGAGAERSRRTEAVTAAAKNVEARSDAHSAALAAEGVAKEELKAAKQALADALDAQKVGAVDLEKAGEKQHILTT